jgi:hypothetical protein
MTEGAGKAGCAMHPQPRVRNFRSTRASHHRFTETIRPSLRNGFNGLLRALPGDRAFLPPSLADIRRVGPKGPTSPFRQLDASVGASGPHGFTVRNCIVRPRACNCTSRPTLPRPPHPTPRFVTNARTPLLEGWNARKMGVIWGQRKAIYFLLEDWTGRNRLKLLMKFELGRRGQSPSSHRTVVDGADFL